MEWRLESESNRRTWSCSPLHGHSAIQPLQPWWSVADNQGQHGASDARIKSELTDSNRQQIGAGNETRTRDPDLGKVVLYQLSYSRIRQFDSC
jgi:hypothetical protein